MPKVKMDAEMQAFANAVLESIGQGKRGEGRVTTPEQIAARRAASPGIAQPVPRVPTTIHFDADVIAALKASGPEWETHVNMAVREWLRTHSERVASETD